MKLAQLEAFLAVVDRRSFSEAALYLNMSQAAISYAVAEFEKELGTKLLERGRFGARPTSFGESLTVHARAILQQQAAIMQKASATQGSIRGILKIATFRSAAGKLLPPIMASIKKQHPQLSIQLVEIDEKDETGRDKEQLLRERLADVAFTENAKSAQENDDLMNWEVTRDDYQGIVPTSDPRSKLNWQALEEDNFIFSACIFCGDTLRNHLQSLSLNAEEPSYFVREDSTILRMVSQELGVSVLPELAIDELPKNVKIIPMSEPLERSIAVAVLPSVLKTPAVRVFLKELRQHFPDSGIPAFKLPKALSKVA